jgi:hypothetical protein
MAVQTGTPLYLERRWLNMPVRDLLFSASGASAPSDPDFEYVSLLLNGDGTNGAQNNTFLDSSTNNFTITRNGNTTQGSFSPYGTLWSNFFNGSSALSVSSTSSQFSFSGDFTWETWINFNALPTSGNIAGILFSRGANASASAFQFFIFNSSGTFSVNATISVGSTDTDFGRNIPTAPVVGVWYHVALVRSSNTVKVYWNGTQIGADVTVTGTTNTPTVNPSIGARLNYGDLYFNGYISNLRMVGSAVYTSAFTPSLTPLTAISGTRLLTCQSNRFVDSSTNNFLITTSGSPSVQRFSPFNPTAPYSTSVIGGSGYFDGSGDYLTAPSGAAVSGTGAFTVEFWVYMSATQTSARIVSGPANNITINLSSNGDIDYGLNGVNAIITANIGSILNSWVHVCVARSAGGTARLWANGTSFGTATDSNNYTAGTVTIGSTAVPNFYLTGYLSNVRTTNTDVYGTSNTTITVPTAPITAVTGTRLLLSYTNAGIPDLAMQNNLETVGNAQVSTSVKKYGTGSLAFDGTGDYLDAPNSSLFNLVSGDFTIEFWFNTNTLTPTNQFACLVGCQNFNGTTGAGWGVFQYDQEVRFFWAGATGSFVTGNVITSTGTWYHIAVVRSGTATNNTKIYINGVQQGQGTPSITNSTQVLVVGGIDTTSGWNSNLYSNGYIDDLRITKGLARYTANFTPPTAALPTF